VKKYPTDLTDSQWNHIKDLFPEPKAVGRPREIGLVQSPRCVKLSLSSITYRLSPIPKEH
jgi:transposase